MCREARRGVATGELADLRGDPVKYRFFSLLGGLDGCVNPAGGHGHSVEIHTAGGECWGSEPDAGGVEGLAPVEGHRVVINDDPGSVECLGDRLAGEILRGEIYDDQVGLDSKSPRRYCSQSSVVSADPVSRIPL